MQSAVKEGGFAPGLKVGQTADQKLAGQEKSIVLQFQHNQLIEIPVFCDYAEPAISANAPRNPRIFIDRLGAAWKCNRMMTCDHAILVDGVIHSCRYRTRQIMEAEHGAI